MKRKASVGDVLATAKKKQYETYSPPCTPWLKAVSFTMPPITLAFAKTVVAAWDGSPDDKCAASMKELLDYHNKSPWVNTLVSVKPYPADAYHHSAIVSTKHELVFARSGSFKHIMDDDCGNDFEYALDDKDVTTRVLVYPLDQCDATIVGDALDEGNPIREWIEASPRRKAAFDEWVVYPRDDTVRATLKKHGALEEDSS
jgi:hypothetical protein